MANPNLRMTIEARTSGEQDLSNIGAAIDRLAAKIGDLGKKSEESNNRTAASFKSVASQLSQAFSGDVFGAASKGLQSLAAGFGAAGAAAAGAIEVFRAAGSALADLTVGQARIAREQVNFATRLGITTAEGLKFSAMAKIAGVDGNSLATASRFIANALEDQSGAGKRAFEALQKLGVATRTQSGEARELGQVTLDTVKALGSIDDAAKRVALSSAILGRGGTKELQPLLEHYRELDESLKQLGITLDVQATDKLAKANDEIGKMSVAWGELRKKLAEKIAPIAIPVFVYFTPGNKGAGAPIHGRGSASFEETGIVDPYELKLNPPKGPGVPAEYDRQVAAIVQDLTLGKANASKNAASALFTPEGIDRQISDLKKKAQEQRDISTDQSVGAKAQNEAKKKAELDEGEIRRLELRKKLIDENKNADEQLLKVRQQVARLVQGEPVFQSQRMYQQFAAQPGVSDAQRRRYAAELQPLFQKESLEALAKAFAKGDEDLAKVVGNENVSGFRGTALLSSLRGQPVVPTAVPQNFSLSKILTDNEKRSEEFRGTLERQDRQLAEGLKVGPEAVTASNQIGQARAESAANIQGQFGGAGYELQTASRLAGIKRDYAQKQYDFDISLIAARAQYDENAVQEKAARDAEYAKQLAEIQIEQSDRVAQYQLQKRQEFRSAVEGGTSALLSGGQRGLADFVRGKAIGLAATIAGNAADAHYGVLGAMIPTIPGQTKTDANGNQTYTALGNLLKGTILGAELKSPAVVSTDLNTTATNLNSSAVAALYNAITGQSLPGITSLGAPLSGSAIPASGLFSATLGSRGTGSSPLSSLSAFGSTVSSAGFPQIGAAIQQAASIAAIVQGGGGSLGSLDHSIATTDDVFGSGGISTNDNGLGAAVNVLKGTLSAPSQTDAIINATKGGGGPNVLGILTGSQTDSSGNVQDFSGAQRIAGGIATAGVVAQGVQQAVHGFSSGGAYGVFSGIGGAAQAAAAVDPEPVSAAALQIAAQTAKIIAAVIGDPRAAREHEISRRLFEDKYTAPTALNVTGSTYGTYSDVNENGIVRTSKFSPFPTVSEAYIDLPRRAVVPGQVLSQFGGGGSVANPGPGTHVTVHVQTMDSKSFNDNGYKIADALHGAILGEGHPVVSEIGYQLGVK